MSTRITVSLGDRDYTELRSLATQADVSLSWLVRHAITEFLKRHRRGEELQLPLRFPGNITER